MERENWEGEERKWWVQDQVWRKTGKMARWP
jgi:hypothetical protein